MKFVLLFFAIAFLVGCVPYPIYKTLQPESEAVVASTSGEPIEDAQVTLISNSYPYGFEKTRVTKTTNESGRVEFNGVHEWRMEYLGIHGAEVFFWNWCVYKKGYETYLTRNNSSKKFERILHVPLKRGEATACPEPDPLH